MSDIEVERLKELVRAKEEEVKALRRKLEETERAGEDIRKKNVELLEANKAILAGHPAFDGLGKMDVPTMATRREDIDWKLLGEKYDLFLCLAKKHGIAIVVMP